MPTLAVTDDTLRRLDQLVQARGTSREAVLEELLDRSLSHEEWLIQELRAGSREIEAGELASPEEVESFFAR